MVETCIFGCSTAIRGKKLCGKFLAFYLTIKINFNSKLKHDMWTTYNIRVKRVCCKYGGVWC